MLKTARLSFLHTLVLALSIVCVASPAFADAIVVPNFAASTVGNTSDGSSGSTEPFDIRLQQIYGSGQFGSVGGPLLIDQFAFRASPGTGALSTSFENIDIYFSTSQYFPNLNGGPGLLLTDDFATNLGPDNTLVYSGPGGLASPGCAENGSTPCPFDILFTLTTPFLYDPALGRLLIDFHLTGLDEIGQEGALDAVFFGDLPTPYGPTASLVGLLDSPTGEFDPGGIVTQFNYTPVPEPASVTLLLTGLGGFVAARRSKKQRNAK